MLHFHSTSCPNALSYTKCAFSLKLQNHCRWINSQQYSPV